MDEQLMRTLLREQHPDLAGEHVRPAATGWDNELWRLGDGLAVRVPRTERAPDLLRKEYRWVPELAPRLPLPVPVPLRWAEPSERFAKPWAVTTWVDGEPADRAVITRGDHAAETLAGFLRALHRPAPDDAPANADRGVDLAVVAAGVEDGFRSLVPSALLPAVREVWDDAASAPPWAGPRTWLHGDLHPANVTVADGTLAGVIDFGELCAGDPATDLAAAWTLLPVGASARFFAVYGGADDATVRRARGWSLRTALGLISVGRAGEQGLPGGKPTWLPAGLGTIDRVLADAG
ncbi:aminoglycoside phosphotransferase family protein [Jiangella alkaliphila]|uniref:Predicted kinase, aminoglycoside phosphotransferase (APT) family n=1 Tax=Jiangella alkaliphila TaxID=419479 RepID=A0A1H2KSL7_9ACTN|nr:aminoglycoside phosphotransferase family protein [Jiangella alkaliphila]SDU71687.1 Predicted kinase, aminoglycoside phosphotransferase (APT) family [Jiangella alkaliphila]